MIINGIRINSGNDSLLSYNNSTFWIVAGVLLFIFYPILLEFCLWIHGHLSTPEPPIVNNLIPIAYSPKYNIKACGVEKLHPFDSEKYGRVFNSLILPGKHLIPIKCPRSILMAVHPFYFLLSLCYSIQLFRAVEIPVCILPAPFLRWKLLDPMLYATYGSILAGCAAINNRKYGINLSGGYHHASSTSCGGFCIYADIALTIYWLRKWYPQVVNKAMIIDLDAHQGNGHENDFLNDENVFIIDFFNPNIYPNDIVAKQAIKYQEKIRWEYDDALYLEKLDIALSKCIPEFRPDFIVYNAGTDCMVGDPLGSLNITRQGIIIRDEIVFTHAIQNKVPILMLLSGGYQLQNAPTIAESIENMIHKFDLFS